MRLLLLALILCLAGCASTSVANIASQGDEDVLILTLLIQDYLSKTDGRDINLTDLIKKDSLSRIQNSFKTLTQELKGHISVYYTFSESRNSKGIKLSDKEKELTKHLRWTEKRSKNQYDGEIQIDYGERFYRLIRIIKNKTD